jgi:hypothetical protein
MRLPAIERLDLPRPSGHARAEAQDALRDASRDRGCTESSEPCLQSTFDGNLGLATGTQSEMGQCSVAGVVVELTID